MFSLMILGIIVPLVALPKPDDHKSLGTNGTTGAEDGPTNNNGDPTFFRARELSPSSSTPWDYVADNSDTDLSGHQATSQSPQNLLPPPDVTMPTSEGTVHEPALRKNTKIRGNITNSSILENCPFPFKLENKVLILFALESGLALITIRFQAVDDSSSLLTSFLVTMVVATTVFGFTFTLVGLMLEKINPVAAAVSSHAASISVVLGFFFMIAVFVPERLVWLLWAAGVVLSTVYVYCLAKPICTSYSSSLINCVP